MTEVEADVIIALFVNMIPGWCRRARKAENITTEPFCPICGTSAKQMSDLRSAIILKLKNKPKL